MNVVLDADFLSAFLKIEALHRIRKYFGANKLLLPPAVFREIAVTTLLPSLVNAQYLQVREVDEEALARVAAAGELVQGLGAGEREAIALAIQAGDSTLLMNDRIASRCAETIGVSVVNVPAFLLGYRAGGPDAAKQVREMVVALEREDHYGFGREVRDKLMG